jgi:peptidoglycan/LPS O-acetylase OafA/YrhL
MRALAVLAVLLFHLWPNRLTGGYVGVDVFFVISGYLITSHLLSEVLHTGRLRLGRFWARRAKRLLPASLLVLFTTAVAVVVLVPVARWSQFLTEVSASALYVQNWLLASNSVDYLAAAGDTPSPVQHFWTLSVEEQFYVVVPLLLLAGAWIARRAAGSVRRAALVTVAGVTVVSLGYSIWLTATAAPVSYFSTFSRAWEFGVGALIAFIPSSRRIGTKVAATVAGVGAVLAAAVLFSEATTFPGAAAALPVVGTALAIWGGRGTPLEWSGRIAPVAFVGAASYAIYLWHWPFVILLPYATGHPLTTADKVGVIIATFVIAWASTRFLEDPVRFSPRLLGGKRRPRTVAAWSVAGMLAVLAVSVPAVQLAERQDEAAAVASARLQAGAECIGAAVPATGCAVDADLQGTVLPVGALRQDDANRSECWSTEGDGSLQLCSLGPEHGYEKHLLAVGDSHNNTLVGVYESIANTMNWRIDVAGRIGCYLTDADLEFGTTALNAECEQWRDQVKAHLEASDDLDGVIVTNARNGKVVSRDGESVADATVQGLTSAWESVPDGVPVLGLVDNPVMPAGTVDCVEQNGLGAAEACAVPRATALRGQSMQKAVASVPRAHLLDLSDLYCEPDVCRPVVGNVVVYRDAGHLTATYARTLAPYLGEQISRAIG